MSRSVALHLIDMERDRQDAKFGTGDNDDGVWITVLMEELGEVARAMLERNPEHMLYELTQVAAVALAWMEKRVG